MNVVILEDEPRAARELSEILTRIDGRIKVLAVFDAVSKAVEWFEQHEQPDLVLSDIQLADGLCFEIFRKVAISSPVIFCTAFDEYLMNAFDSNAVSYLLKPITKEKIAKALDKLSRLRSAFEKEPPAADIEQLLRQLKHPYKTALLVNLKEKIIPLQVKEIAFFYLNENVVHITTVTNQHYSVSSSLEELEIMLDPAVFYRANRQFLVNRYAIANAERYFARKLVARLIVPTPETIIVSKAKASDFLQWLEKPHS